MITEGRKILKNITVDLSTEGKLFVNQVLAILE